VQVAAARNSPFNDKSFQIGGDEITVFTFSVQILTQASLSNIVSNETYRNLAIINRKFNLFYPTDGKNTKNRSKNIMRKDNIICYIRTRGYGRYIY